MFFFLFVFYNLDVMCELCAERWAEFITDGGLHLCAECFKQHLEQLQ